mmetsp:Transcript_48578/g.120447  ORF Transcript_48578/g.120447 Transcript_48578/m.120447 type:complete len:458 (-) Transcript_48578:1500-2873(-)
MSSISSAVGSMARSAPTCSASRGLSEMEGSSIRSRICASLSRRRARAISMLFARFRSISRMRAELGGSEARGESARSDVARLRRGLSCSGGSANMASSLTKSSSASDSESDELCSLSELPESSRLKSIDLPLSPLTDPRRFDFGLRRTFFAACTGSDQSVLPTIEAGSFVQWSGRMGTVGSGCGEQEGEACSDAPMLEAWDSNVGGGGGGGGTGEPGSRGEFSGGGSSGGGGGGGGASMEVVRMNRPEAVAMKPAGALSPLPSLSCGAPSSALDRKRPERGRHEEAEVRLLSSDPSLGLPPQLAASHLPVAPRLYRQEVEVEARDVGKPMDERASRARLFAPSESEAPWSSSSTSPTLRSSHRCCRVIAPLLFCAASADGRGLPLEGSSLSCRPLMVRRRSISEVGSSWQSSGAAIDLARERETSLSERAASRSWRRRSAATSSTQSACARSSEAMN